VSGDRMSTDPHSKEDCDLGGCDICLSYWELLALMLAEAERPQSKQVSVSGDRYDQIRAEHSMLHRLAGES
jgi:hypothetical protein